MTLKNNAQDKVHTCPFCDEEIAAAAFPYCQACGVKILRCPSCQLPVPRDKEKCPHCGADIRKVVKDGGS
jgi:predicted amidophosphoribosyltransferase